MVFGKLECAATIHLKNDDGHEYVKKHLTLNQVEKDKYSQKKTKVAKPIIQGNNKDNANHEKHVIIQIVPDTLDSNAPDHEKCQKTIEMTLSIALIDDATVQKMLVGKDKKEKLGKAISARALKIDLGICDFQTGLCANAAHLTADNLRTVGDGDSYTIHSNHSNSHSTPESKHSDANHKELTVVSHQPPANSHPSSTGSHSSVRIDHENLPGDESKVDQSEKVIHSPENDTSFITEYLDPPSGESHSSLPTESEDNKSHTGHTEPGSQETNKTIHSTLALPSPVDEIMSNDKRSKELSGHLNQLVPATDQNKKHDETPEASGSPKQPLSEHSSNHASLLITHGEDSKLELPEKSPTAIVTASPGQTQELTDNHQKHSKTPQALSALIPVDSHSSSHREVEQTEHDDTVGKSHTSELVRSKPVHFILHGHLYCGKDKNYAKNEVSATIRLRESHLVESELGNKIKNTNELHVEEDFSNHQKVKASIGPANIPIFKYIPVKEFGKVPRYSMPGNLINARLSNVCEKKNGHECKEVEQIRLDIEPKVKECNNHKPISTTIQLKRMDKDTDESTKGVVYKVDLGSCNFQTGHCSELGKYIKK